MDLTATLAELERLGTEQNRKVYRRHGVRGEIYGVSFANLGALKKKVRVDQGLAEALWATGNHDARVLATMVADPRAVTDEQLEAWARDLDSYVIVDAFTALAARTPQAHARISRWTAADDEWLSGAGWQLVAHLAPGDPGLSDAELAALLATIERQIHSARNRTRHAMNSALIAIGCRSDALAEQAIAAARRIGRVEVDHGETGCKTPDAVGYIPKARARQQQREQKARKR